MPCREVIKKGQKDIEVIGPTTNQELIKDIIAPHINYWNNK